MKIKNGEHGHRDLGHGVVVYATRKPGSRWWRIDFVEQSWIRNFVLWSKTWWPQRVGWDRLKFHNPDDAASFVKSKMRVSVA
jgi:hypothetical protein